MGTRLLMVALAFYVVPLQPKAQHKASFFEEHIDFCLDNDYFSINGVYSFYNNSDVVVNQHIIYPLAVNVSAVDSIRITDLNRLVRVSYRRMNKAISFDINIPPKDTLDVNIFYRQKALVKNTYILTTTQAWGQPLDKAIYTLTTPQSISIKTFSYSPDSMSLVNDEKLYVWAKRRFLPQLDFEITIKEAMVR